MIRSLIRLTIIVTGWYFVLPAIAESAQCTVTFGFAGETSVSGLLAEVEYSGSSAEPIGERDAVECESHVKGALATFNNVVSTDVVKAGVVRLESFGGQDIFSCSVEGIAPSADDFTVRATDATDSTLQSVTPLPDLAVSAIDCGDDAPVATAADEDAGEPAGGCEITFTIESATPVSGLIFDVGYGQASVEIAGSGETAECMNLVGGALAVFNDQDDDANLVTAMVHVAGFSGPTAVAECYLDAESVPDVEAFTVTVQEAIDPSGADIHPLPAMAVGEISCGGAHEEDGYDADGGEYGDDGEAGGETGAEKRPEAASECGGAYDVTLGVDGSGTIAALQFDIGYANAAGGFAGSGEHVKCISVGNAASAYSGFRDGEDIATINAALVSLEGFASPTDLVRCRFDAEGRAPVPGDFSIEVSDAARPDVSPIVPMPQVSVVAITAAGDNDGCAGVCGNGTVEFGEACDDGNTANDDACLDDCTPASCGDGHLWGGVEECDGGSGPGSGGCRSDCTLALCGDGVVDAGEECDDGNADEADSCLTGCIAARCGDGVVQEGAEACDDGEANNDADPYACRTNCSLPVICGDADANGTLTPTDAKRIIDHSIGLASECELGRCDVNGTAEVSPTDARLVLNASVGLEADLHCWLSVVFSIDGDDTVGALEFVVDHSGTGSTFVGAGDAVYCTDLTDGDVLFSANNDIESQRLHVALVSLEGVQAPADVLACSFYQPAEAVDAEDFAIEVIDATDPEVETIEPPVMSVDF